MWCVSSGWWSCIFVAFSKKSYHTKAEVDLCNSDNLCVT